MTIVAIKKEIVDFVENADSKKLKALFNLIIEDAKEEPFEYTASMKKEIQKRLKEIEENKVWLISWNDAKKNLLETL